MKRLAVDFGTGNTVLALLEQGSPRARTLEIPGVSRPAAFQLPGDPAPTAHIIPSVIHYGANRTLVGAQVEAAGLLEDSSSLRWMKRGVAYGVSRRRKTLQGHKSPADAAGDLLRLLLSYCREEISFETDEVTFTAPVEAFEDFRDWLLRVAESLGLRRARFVDEATAAILSQVESVRPEERFLVVDLGCGTVDASVVRVDLTNLAEPHAVQLGQAGRDLGGLDIDRWIVADLARRHGLADEALRAVEPTLLRRAEAAKIELASLRSQSVEIALGESPKTGSATSYRLECGRCAQARSDTRTAEGCLGCLLEEHGFLRGVRETISRALENAAVKCGLRRSQVTRVVATGGTSLLPQVARLLEEELEGKVERSNPFDAVARGACRGLVAPILQHDYAIESYDPKRRAFSFQALFSSGAEYPTPEGAVRLWARGSYDGMTRIGIKVFEVSRVSRRSLDASLVDEAGRLLGPSQVGGDFVHLCLNQENPTFIAADPPVDLARDVKRFLCSFQVDANRRLLVTVQDQLAGKVLLCNHPVVRL